MADNFPIEFYQEEQEPAIVRTSDPNGGVLLDPLDLLGPTPWTVVNTRFSVEGPLKKRNLIFADPAYKSRDQHKKNDIMMRLNQAKRSGFKIYILVDNKLEEWNGDDIPDDYEVDLKKTTLDNIRNMALKEHKLSANSICLLDYFATNELISTGGIHNLIISDFISNEEETNTLDEFLSYLSEDKIAQKRLKKITFDAGNFLELCDILKGKRIDFFEEVNIKKLNKGNDFQKLFKIASNLKKIDLSHCENISGCFEDLQENQLQSLEEIDLSFSDIKIKDIKQLLIVAPNLKKIDLSHCENISGCFEGLNKNQLKSLEGIILGHSDINVTDIKQLLIAAPNLKTIALTYCNNISSCFEGLQENQLQSLEEIDLKLSDIKIKDIKKLLIAAPNLKKIGLAGCKNISGCFEGLNKNQLQSLEEIILERSDINVTDIKQLLIAAPNLKIIDLSYCENISGCFEGLNKNQLQSLEGIILDHSDINVTDIKQLLITAPNLKTIDLSACKNISGCFEGLNKNQLQSLEGIILDHSDINVTDIKQLLITAPNLKTIDLSACKNISGCFEGLNKNQLQLLEVMDLRDSDINAEDIKQLLMAAPNLKTIVLSGCKNISGCFEGLNENQLQLLKVMSLRDSDINAEDLKKLSKVAPNLRILHVENQLSKKNDAPQPQKSKVNKSSPALSMSEAMNQKTDLDFSSESSNPTVTFTKYFPDVQPWLYRLFVWKPDLDSTDLTRKYVLPTDFKSVSDHDNPLKKLVYSPKEYIHQKGMIATTPSSGNKIILPSINAEEKITKIQVVDEKGQAIDDKDIKLEHSEEAGFYRVVLPKAGKYTIHFEVAIPNEEPKISNDLDDLVRDYNEFKPSDQKFEYETLREYAAFYREKKTGRCELRSLAAYAELLESENYKEENVRIIANDVHAYLEVKVKNEWHKLDLGGYPTQLTEQPMPTYTQKQTSSLKEEQFPERSETKIEAKDLVFETNVIPKTNLYLVHNISELKRLYDRCASVYKPDHIFVVDEVAKLNLTGHGINQQGQILPNYTNLQRWLSKHEQQEGAIVVDMRALKDNEIPQLNDLLDRKIEGKTLPENIQIILIDTPERGYYGPDFRRRVPSHLILNTPEEPLLLEVPKERENPPITRIEIDLFNSPFYERMLLGFWRLQENTENPEAGLRLAWQESELFKAIKEAKGAPLEIVLKNPPLQNPKFKTCLVELQAFCRLDWADQTLSFPNNVSFYQASGYDWANLIKDVVIEQLNKEDVSNPSSELYCLSDTNILSFINDPAYFFSKKTEALECQDSHLTRAATGNKQIRIVCAPGLSESALAQFLTEAHKRHVKVSLVTPDLNNIPVQSVLHHLPLKPKSIDLPVVSANNVAFELHSDVYFRTQQMQMEKGFKGTFFNMSSLSAADLGHFPAFSEKETQAFLKTSTLLFKAPLSAIANKLKNGETVVLTGTIPPALYEALTQLSLGYIDGERFKGQLRILASSQEQSLVQDITGQKLTVTEVSPKEKQEYIQKIYGKNLSLDEAANHDLATLERTVFKQKIGPREPLSKTNVDSDEDHSKEIDSKRLRQVKKALGISPWVMLGGKTGFGKTNFLQNVLPREVKVFNTIEDWLKYKPKDNELVVLAFDEANFNTQLSNMGDNFLERFSGLKNNPPGFLWKGQYYPLTPQHKVVFAFNPSTYGQGRKGSGLLQEHNVPVSFHALPYFYVRARVIDPILTKVLKNKEFNTKLLSGPMVDMYTWLTGKSDEEVLITPREIKAMINLMAAKINRDNITDEETLTRIAIEVAYDVGRQTVMDNQNLLMAFDKNFPKPQRVISRTLPENSSRLSYQAEAYRFIQEMLYVKDHILSSGYVDLGLGGVILEGPSNIGKTFFINEIAKQYSEDTKKPVYRISPSTPYTEKVKIIKQAATEGALLLAEEFNTSLWPNKLLNNVLMGLDEAGEPLKNPGFMLIATQNPPSFEGRSEEDPAIRRRLAKLSLDDWPQIAPKIVSKDTAQPFTPSYTGVKTKNQENQENKENKDSDNKKQRGHKNQ